MSGKVQFSPNISIGTLVVLGTQLALAGGTFFVLDYRVGALESDQKEDRARIEKVVDERSNLNGRLSGLEAHVKSLKDQISAQTTISQQILTEVRSTRRFE